MQLVTTEKIKNAIIISISGEITMITVGEIDNVCKNYIDSDIEVLALDLKDVQFIDSFGISRIIKQSKIFTDKDIHFVLINMNGNIHQIFKVATFDRMFTIMTKAEFTDKYLN